MWKLYIKEMLPIVNAHVTPGTVVHTDQWAAYNHIGTLPNMSTHSTVNHFVTFADPVSDTHTQNVKSYWNGLKG